MKHKYRSGIFTPSGRRIWPHEDKVAQILAMAGHNVEFLMETNLKTADILLDGVPYEIKSPERFNANTLEHTIKNALKQSSNLVIDMSRMKGVRSNKMRNFLINQVRKSKQIKKMLLITRQGQIIDIVAIVR